MSSNHPNRNWQRRWTVDLEACTATHEDGWVFEFEQAHDDEGWRNGECTRFPDQFDYGDVARKSWEAGEAFTAALKKRH